MIMKTKSIAYLLFFILALQGCIKDDIIDDLVDPVLRITTNVDTLAFGSTLQFEEMYLDNVGREAQVEAVWSSSDETIISISDDGLAIALEAGSATISVEYDDGAGLVLRDDMLVHVGENTAVSLQTFNGNIQTTTFYVLEGDFTYSETEDGLRLEFENNYRASAGLPGLYIYLSNNKNSIAGAFEIGEVETFSGAHSYDIPDVGFSDYSHIVYFCKPFNVKVGDGDLSE